MGILLKEIYNKNIGIEKKFKHRAILFIPTESYDGPIITILQGLQELGFRVYTIQRPNINSWFVNEVVETPEGLKFDFVLSNLHWGTRWDYINKFKLHGYLKVLFDGCDNRGNHSWKGKYHNYCKKYRRGRPSPSVLAKSLHPHRWMEPLHGYKPDIVFTLQKIPGSKDAYLPYGIHRESLKLYEGKSGAERKISFASFPGPGSRKGRLTRFLKANHHRLPGKVHYSEVRGPAIVPKKIRHLVDADKNVHSYHRWRQYRDYFRVLNNTKVLIFPGVAHTSPWWDSKRPWEGYASGCLVLYEKPAIDMSEYPVTLLCPKAQYNDYEDLVYRCKRLYSNLGRLEHLRREAVGGALKYFTPVPLARFFLGRIKSRM